MRAAVIHSTLNGLGGAEKVSLATIKLLKNMGFKVVFISLEPTNWLLVSKVFRIGSEYFPDSYLSILPFEIRKFTIYTKLFASKIMDLKIRDKYDLVINTHGDSLPIATDIVYMHFPGFVAEEFSISNKKYFESLPWKIYYYGYVIARSFLLPSFTKSVIVTNSSYSKGIIKYKLGIDALVIYPVIDTEAFTKAFELKKGNEPYRVVSIGRFSPEKNYEFVLKTASLLKDVEFFIVGSASTFKSLMYLKKILILKRKLGLRNVFIKTNLSQNDLLKLLSSARVIFHAMKHEHFGMVVAEGMVAGLIPVVHRSGGVYYDVIKRGRYGYSYITLEEAAESIYKALDTYPKLYDQIHSVAVKRFSAKSFNEKMKNIIVRVLENK